MEHRSDDSSIRVGVIGCGYWGPNLVRTLSDMEGSELVAVSDLRSGRLEFINARHPKIATTTKALDIIGDPTIDAVVIATPPQTHYELTMAALRGGKHVLVEKPLACSVEESERMVGMADQLNRVLMVGHLFLYSPAVANIRSLLNEKQAGDLYYISSVRTNVGPPGAQMDVLWDLAPHDISVIHNLMQAEPEEVYAFGGAFAQQTLAETVFLTMRFGDGRLAQVHVGWLTPNKTRLMRMVCSRGEIVYDDMQTTQKIQLHSPAVDNRVAAGAKNTSLGYSSGGVWCPPVASAEPLRLECADFLRCIRDGCRPLSNGQAGLAVVRVLERASQLLQNGGRSEAYRFSAAAISGVAQ
jgi:predicted dehydrogenase